MHPRRRFPLWPVFLALVVLAATWGLWRWHAQRVETMRLPDGTVAYFRAGTTVQAEPGYPRPREIHVNGDLFLRVPGDAQPLVVRSRLLELTIAGEAELRVTAFAAETGEQAEVLHGHVVARKAYASTSQGPDTLLDGDMVMVNQTIDLMEKEKDTPGDLQRWRDTLLRAAGAPAETDSSKK